MQHSTHPHCLLALHPLKLKLKLRRDNDAILNPSILLASCKTEILKLTRKISREIPKTSPITPVIKASIQILYIISYYISKS